MAVHPAHTLRSEAECFMPYGVAYDSILVQHFKKNWSVIDSQKSIDFHCLLYVMQYETKVMDNSAIAVWNRFESEDGVKVEESGSQKQVGETAEDSGTVSKGSYSFTAPDGVVLTVNWVADENGFQPTGDHLPTPPPMPEHVVKLLADLKAAGVLE